MHINEQLTVNDLAGALERFWDLAAGKVRMLEERYDPALGSPVFTVGGAYTSRGWTEWTQGFQYGIPLLISLAREIPGMLETGRRHTLEDMTHHLTHFGVHDHGFNNLSTYGNLLRAANRGVYTAPEGEPEALRQALKVSGAVQARRWTEVHGGGFICSFNGPHSLFIDTLRTCRILLVSHMLGHRLLEEGDREVSLLERALVHGMTTARYAVYYGEGRDRYDVRGRTAHESIFNTNDGSYRCPNSQQGYSGYTTWTRGLGWAMLGFAECLEFLREHGKEDRLVEEAQQGFMRAARAVCDYYLEQCASDGIPYWDTGAPGLHQMGYYRERPAEPDNPFEPVDSSAAAIAAQGLIRLGLLLEESDESHAKNYLQAGFTILETLLSDTYLSTSPDHQGILLHSLYHRPNGWDHVPEGAGVPRGESSMWGDYHMTELCYLADQIIRGNHYTFYSDLEGTADR